MPGLLHALLIGIDAYDGGGSLRGCVNDIDAVQRLLVDRVGVSREHIVRLASPLTGAAHETDVPAKVPTLANIMNAFEAFATDRISSEDRLYVHYSGHGTQCLVSDARGRRFSREALVPKDKKAARTEQRLLFDSTLNALLARIAERIAGVTIVLDCCCSAGAVRSALESPGTRPRYWLSEHAQAVGDDTGKVMTGSGRLARDAATLPCCVVAACLDDERAYEASNGDRVHGALTRALLDQWGSCRERSLRRSDGNRCGALHSHRYARLDARALGCPADASARCSGPGRPSSLTPAWP